MFAKSKQTKTRKNLVLKYMKETFSVTYWVVQRNSPQVSLIFSSATRKKPWYKASL